MIDSFIFVVLIIILVALYYLIRLEVEGGVLKTLKNDKYKNVSINRIFGISL